MSVSDADERVRLVRRDVESTLGPKFEDVVTRIGARVREHNNHLDREDYIRTVAGAVQEEFHSTFLDTTWPACPHHRRHPLWLWGDIWVCGQLAEPVAALGNLAYAWAEPGGFIACMDDGKPSPAWSPRGRDAPMAVVRDDSDAARNAYVAEIVGFFDAKTAFWAQVFSRTAAQRDLLIASVGTLRRVAEG
jgi:hypothetical protein